MSTLPDSTTHGPIVEPAGIHAQSPPMAGSSNEPLGTAGPPSPVPPARAVPSAVAQRTLTGSGLGAESETVTLARVRPASPSRTDASATDTVGAGTTRI